MACITTVPHVHEPQEHPCPSPRPRIHSTPSGARWSSPRFLIALVLIVARHRLDRLLLHRGPRRPDRVPGAGRRLAEVHGATSGDWNYADRLRAADARPDRLRPPLDPARPRPRRRGRHAGLLPDRPAVDLHLLRLQRRPLRASRSSTTSASRTWSSASPSWRSASPSPPAGSSSVARTPRRTADRRSVRTGPAGVAALSTPGCTACGELQACSSPQVCAQLWRTTCPACAARNLRTQPCATACTAGRPGGARATGALRPARDAQRDRQRRVTAVRQPGRGPGTPCGAGAGRRRGSPATSSAADEAAEVALPGDVGHRRR